MSPLNLVALALAGLCTLFALLWLACRRLDNYGFVDVAWAYAFAAVAAFYAWFGPGWFLRRFAIAAMIVLWSVRLGSHLLRRVAAHHPVEDGRYVRLRQDWAGNFGPKMAGFFQLQAASIVLLAIVVLPPVFNPAPRFHLLEMIGAALWFLALYGESIADAQLAAFKRQPENRGRVCAVGLWRLSRHPNYFFEWLVWVAYFVFALASPWGWVAAVAPRHRHSPGRGAGGALQGRRLPPLPGHYERVRALVPKAIGREGCAVARRPALRVASRPWRHISHD